MYFLIISFGFLLALRGAKPAPLNRPLEGMEHIWREAADFLLTTGLILTLWTIAVAFDKTRLLAQDYAILGPGLAAYLLSRYQKKTDAFFLSTLAVVFMIHSKQADFLHGLSLAWAVSAGVALFQTCFLGLRYKLLFSSVPVSAKGWPILCVLAGFVSLVLWSLKSLVF